MKAFFYGTDPAPYHPMKEIAERMREIFPNLEIMSSCREEELQEIKNGQYEICFLYTDFEQPPLKSKTAAALLIFTAAGGGLFAIHGGVALQERPELGQLFGGIFTGHPPYEELPRVCYRVADSAHPVVQGIRDFSISDELYLFELPALKDGRIFLSYEEKGKLYPAGWSREYGLGRVIYLCCGHTVHAFDNEMLCKLMKNGAEWLLERRNEEDA